MDTEQFATYSPEDNKLRLYIGRVPREEFLKLRSEGWVTLHKQREAGGGDFVATWTPDRRETALAYSDGIIYDEDMGPEERAADRAERFSGYRDKRTDEAVGHADSYDGQPSAHGYQSQARAERAAARHDRIGDRAVDAWDKAEYWQRRTAGVISHALYKSSPGVRMGRIKELEAALRKHNVEVEKRAAIYEVFTKLAALEDKEKQTKLVCHVVGHADMWANYMHPRAAERTDYYKDNETSLYSLMTCTTDPITGAEACALFFSDHAMPSEDNDWSRHYKLRLAYENQMLEAQGGRLEQCEVLVGGKLGGKLIIKVSKSSATGRATSVDLLGPKVEGWAYRVSSLPGTEWSAYKFDLERLSPDWYTPPTPESLKELEAVRAKIKAARPKTETIPLLNPTDEDAERLQKLWNERALAEHEKGNIYTSPEARASHSAQFKPSTLCRITQAVYSANSKGTYAKAETRGLKADANRDRRASNMYSSSGQEYDKRTGPVVCTMRITSSDGGHHAPPRVIVLTDKPQKPLPKAVWEPLKVKAEKPEKVLHGKSNGLSYTVNG